MKAVAAAGISMPENPFFVTAVKPYNFKAQYLTVPIELVQEHLDCCYVKSVKHEASDSRQWIVEKVDHCNLGIGWIAFAQKNGVEAGDMYVSFSLRM